MVFQEVKLTPTRIAGAVPSPDSQKPLRPPAAFSESYCLCSTSVLMLVRTSCTATFEWCCESACLHHELYLCTAAACWPPCCLDLVWVVSGSSSFSIITLCPLAAAAWLHQNHRKEDGSERDRWTCGTAGVHGGAPALTWPPRYMHIFWLFELVWRWLFAPVQVLCGHLSRGAATAVLN